ncbi:uncharacterized protein T551_02055 [Pneumocystis jirovecii RU7]|uniref:Uncharacterized protein n=1 Tax=Pneumocystis jirovecii (strain RU7) TaxID=1408657 RepID=A0A0W4ZM42_PNEJ7|nr:uncharacterized protein T551_02055 [Pneumocystis jirovecii RU7]KTW29439.1 hypothetical protein T551_02055 [Pneumocystis jirovecii RU7]
MKFISNHFLSRIFKIYSKHSCVYLYLNNLHVCYTIIVMVVTIIAVFYNIAFNNINSQHKSNDLSRKSNTLTLSFYAFFKSCYLYILGAICFISLLSCTFVLNKTIVPISTISFFSFLFFH